MDNLANRTERKQSTCRKCGQRIFCHRSRQGKPYPTDSETDRRSFHQCVGLFDGQRAKPPRPAPITPDYDRIPESDEFNPQVTVEQRLADLESAVAQMARTIVEIQGRLPITDSDLPDF
jgi:hypothetical protein